MASVHTNRYRKSSKKLIRGSQQTTEGRAKGIRIFQLLLRNSEKLLLLKQLQSQPRRIVSPRISYSCHEFQWMHWKHNKYFWSSLTFVLLFSSHLNSLVFFHICFSMCICYTSFQITNQEMFGSNN